MYEEKAAYKDEISENIEKLNIYEKECERIIERINTQEKILEELRMYKAEIENKKENLILKLHENGIVFERHKHMFLQEEKENVEIENKITETTNENEKGITKDELYSIIQNVIKETLKKEKNTETEIKVMDIDEEDGSHINNNISSFSYTKNNINVPLISPTSLPAPLSISRRR